VAKIEQIAQSFLGAAAANPQQKHEICRQAAYTFMGLAQDPKNARASQQLAEVGLQFARASADSRPPVMDDFADLLQETAAAYEAAGPWGDDPMDLIAMRREIHEDRTPRTPGQIFITPESFNKDATLGRSQKIKWAPTDEEKFNGIQQSQTVAFWQGVKKEAQAMTVDVSLGFLPAIQQQTDTPFDTLNNRAFVEIEFGSDGNRNRFQADLGNGRRITVAGNYVSAIVGMDPPRVGFTSQVIEAGASIGAFAAPSRAPVIRTVYFDDLLTGSSAPLTPIPLRATELLPIVYQGPNLGNFVLYFADAGGNKVATYRFAAPYGITTPIALPGDAVFVTFDNNTGSTIQVRLPFELSV
jgi:hypothetical protein